MSPWFPAMHILLQHVESGLERIVSVGWPQFFMNIGQSALVLASILLAQSADPPHLCFRIRCSFNVRVWAVMPEGVSSLIMCRGDLQKMT